MRSKGIDRSNSTFPPSPPPRNALAMVWPWESLYIARRRQPHRGEEREGGRAGGLINRVVVMDFYLGNNNEVKFGRFPIPKVRRLRPCPAGPCPTISIGVVGERSQLKCLSHFVAYKLLLLSPRSRSRSPPRLGYPPAPSTPPPPPPPAVITCSRSRQLMYF